MGFDNFVSNHISKYEKLLKNRKLIVIANTRDKTPNSLEFELDEADNTEFFSEIEFNEISNALRELDLYLDFYFNELVFIKDVLNHNLEIEDIIVFNLARNGRRQGKKSLIPAFCDLLKIPYTGSDAFTQSLCRNKYVFSKYLDNHNIATPRTYAMTSGGNWLHDKPASSYISKPIAESGSIGVSGSTYKSEFIPSNLEFINDNPLLIQEYLDGDEYEVPIFECNSVYHPLEPTKMSVISVKETLCLNDVLSKANSYEYTECTLKKGVKDLMIDNAVKAARLLNIRNYGRIDFKFDEKNQIPYIIDISATPYLTKLSSFNFMFDKHGYDYCDIFKLIFVLLMKRRTVDPKE